MPDMNNQTAPATNDASKSVDGYATDQSQTGPRRSSRVPTPSKSGSHVNTPADSRQSLGNRPNVPRKQQRRGSGSSAGSTHVAPSSQVSVQNTSKRAPLNTQNRSPLRPYTVHKRTIFKPSLLKKTPKGNNRPPSSARPQSSIAPTSDAGALPESTEDYDFDQDSDIEIKEIESQSRDKANTQDDDDNFSFVEDYFEPPTWKAGDAPGTLLNYKCKWCRVPYRIHGSSRANLKTHRDGSGQTSKNNKGCKQRAKAKTAGHRLPETVAERTAREAEAEGAKNQPKIDGFLTTKRFDNRVLNQLIVIWQVRQALPWNRIEDPYLGAAFAYCNKESRLFSRQWSADEARQLYVVLRRHVFAELNNLDTSFTLIHDVWTTKGNRFAFIGAAATFINSDWQFVVRHLTLKMIPWKHQDSGSNNNTMASKMYDIFELAGASNWDPSTMHIRCVCHKFALIVNAGLAALSLKTLPPGKTKESVLGFFPALGKMVEEPEEDEDDNSNNNGADVIIVNQPDDIENVEEASESDYGNADDEDSYYKTDSEGENSAGDLDQHNTAKSKSQNSENDQTQPGKSKPIKSLELRDLTINLDFVIKKITRSAAQRGPFQKTAENMGINVSPLIAGYGIQWNIKYESHKRAILARDVIDKILKEDQESIEKSRRKSRHKNNSANDTQTSMYGNISFSPRNWEDIEELNAELEVFVKLTQQMKGNHSSGAHVIPKYLELKEELEDKKHAAVESDALYPMWCAMLKRTEKYLDEAMACDSLILATLVHPCFRLSLFTLVFGQGSDEYDRCNSLITQEFARFKDKITTQAAGLGKSTPEAKQKETTGADSKGLMARLALLNKKKPSAQEHELQSFLTADLAFKADDIKDPDFPLKLWKIHSNL
ncbi:hypothetical protein Pst134EB_006263 [Puccinia striiformis f. sp. tritici]|nr:hypothetical protein Pst134EB_006263 [Puccinia striiformis f. sp. tritici]